jgi:hypothetical protein
MKKNLKKTLFLMLVFGSFCSGAQSEDDKKLGHYLRYEDHYYEEGKHRLVLALQHQEPTERKKAALESIALNREIHPEYFTAGSTPLDYFFLSRGKGYHVESCSRIEIAVAVPLWYQAVYTQAWTPLLQLLKDNPEILKKKCNGQSFWTLFVKASPPLEVLEEVEAIHRTLILEFKEDYSFPGYMDGYVTALGAIPPRTSQKIKQHFILQANEAALKDEKNDLFGQYTRAMSELCAAELAANAYDPSFERPRFNFQENSDCILPCLLSEDNYHGLESYFRILATYHLDIDEFLSVLHSGMCYLLDDNKSFTSIPYRFLTAALKTLPLHSLITPYEILERCEKLPLLQDKDERLPERIPQMHNVIMSLKREYAAPHKK